MANLKIKTNQATKPKAKATPLAAVKRVAVRNPNVSGYTSTVDADMYGAMKSALLKVLPRKAPGLTQAEMLAGLTPHLPAALFPGGAKAGWWMKCVQLDLEAQGVVIREALKPLRWHKQ